MRRVCALPGATLNERRHAVEVSLTVETLRAIRALYDMTQREMADVCTPPVLAWARRARTSEDDVNALHARLATGWREHLPWSGAHPPFDHQQIIASACVALDGVAVLADIGTGKTRAVVEALAEKMRRGDVEQAFVVCPKKVIAVWAEEVPLWTTGLTVVALTGSMKQRKATFAAHVERDVVFVTNYESLAPLSVDVVARAQTHRMAFIPDEMHKLKGPNSLRTKAALAIAEACDWRIGMTGTPLLQGIQDIWSQWYVIDLGLTFGASKVQYEREFLMRHPWSQFGLVPKPGAPEAISARLARRGLRFTKEECLDLPPRVYERHLLDMAPDQARAYAAMRDDLVVELEDETIAASTQLVSLLRLAQITSGFLGGTAFVVNPKLLDVVDVVDDNPTPTIIWAWFKRDVAALRDVFAARCPAIVDGTTDTHELFRNGTTDLLIGNPASGGAGLNLQRASLAIYYSQNYSLEARLQSEGRNYRSGSERHASVTYVDLVCRNSIDLVIATALREKKQLADVVLDLRRHIGL